VPPDPEGKGLKLEDCLEEYFNNKVDVLRDSLEEKKGADRPLAVSRRETTIRIVPENGEISQTEHAEDPVLQRTLSESDSIVQSPAETPASSSSKVFDSPPGLRHRSASIIQRIVVNEEGAAPDIANESFLQRARRTGSTVVKAVTIPAWQFFRLIREYSLPLFLQLNSRHAAY